jgi:hypothetical protein
MAISRSEAVTEDGRRKRDPKHHSDGQRRRNGADFLKRGDRGRSANYCDGEGPERGIPLLSQDSEPFLGLAQARARVRPRIQPTRKSAG